MFLDHQSFLADHLGFTGIKEMMEKLVESAATTTEMADENPNEGSDGRDDKDDDETEDLEEQMDVVWYMTREHVCAMKWLQKARRSEK